MFENYNDVLSVNDLCKALQIGKNTAYKLIQEEKIKTLRIGKTHKIPKKNLIKYIKKFGLTID